MKKFLLSTLLLVTSLAYSSHINGGEITYKCLGGNLYEVKLSYFWDCVGGFNPGTFQTINVDGCGSALTLIANQSTLTPGDGIFAGNLCPTAATNTACKKRIDYIGTITLPSACNSWTFSIGSCCRSSVINNIDIATSDSYFHFATLNNTIIGCNNSPSFNNTQLGNFCINQPASFDLAVTETDGHILSYELVSAYNSSNVVSVYTAGYTGATPIAGITINALTGVMNFTPTLLGEYVVVVQVTEKDNLGNILGTVMRDFTIIVSNCANQISPATQGSIQNNTNGIIKPDGKTLQICAGVPFCFDLVFTDPNVGDSILVSSLNILNNLPGASLSNSYTPGVKNSCKTTICWTPTPLINNTPYYFSLTVKDNACPVLGYKVVNYYIDVTSSAYAGNNQTICGTQSAQINAVGTSTVFSWADLAGNLIPVNTEFSCNPCANPIAKPISTQTYVLTNSGAASGCTNKDTVIIYVAPNFSVTAGSTINSNCLNSPTQFTSNAQPTGTYNYVWLPNNNLNSNQVQNPIATFTLAGNYTYSLSITSSLGCNKIVQTNSVNIITASSPVFSVTPTYSTTNIGGAVKFDINFGGGAPTSCGLALTNCLASNTIQIGTDATTNNSTSYPSVFGNFYKNSRHQILYKASELLAAGVVAGKLSSISFFVSAINGTINYPNFTIKIKCTTETDLSSVTFDNLALEQVYTIASTSITTGWNEFVFQNNYNWDGASNILIDVCNDLTTNYTNNSSSPFTITPFQSVRYYRDDSGLACGTTMGANTSPNRPNIIFGNCSIAVNTNNYTYSWSPITGLDNPNIKNPIATVNGLQTYTVTVTPIGAPSCNASSTSTVDVLVTSLNQISGLGNSISIYPNPHKGLFEINFSNDELFKQNNRIELKILNAIGQTIQTAQLSSQKTTINMSHLNNGIYFIELTDANSNQKIIQKIILQK